MPGQDPLSTLGDLAALTAQADKIIEIVGTISSAIKAVPGISLDYKNSSGGAELKKNTEDLVKANNELTQAQRVLNQEQEKAKTLEGDMAKQIAIVREQNRAKTADLRAEAREAAGLNDAYKKLTLQYQEAARAAKNLAATPGADPREIQAANAKANSLATQLKAIDAAVGQHQRNVGDYIGAISILDKSLGEIKNRMDQLNGTEAENGAEMRRLQKEYALLTSLSNQQARGFTSLTMEIRAGEKALQTMRAAGMEGSEAFEAMQTRVAAARREFNEFSKSQQLLESAAPKLQALTTIAKGLGGAYAVAAGGAALLADGDEKVEKELNKLVAIMTILQGLQEVHELLEKKGAIATIASGIAQSVRNFVMVSSTKTLAAKTAAEGANTAAEEVNTVATEANTVAQGEQAIATEATAAATDVATTSLSAFRVALLATGIGVVLILLTLAAAAMEKFGKSAKEAAKEAADLAEANKALTEALLEEIETMNNADQATKNYYQNQLALAQAAGVSQLQQLAIKKQLAAAEREEAQENLDSLQSQLGGEAELLAQYQLFHSKKMEALKINAKAIEDGDKRAQQTSSNLIDMYGKQEEAAKASYDAVHKAHTDLYNAIQKEGQTDEEIHRLQEQEKAEFTKTLTTVRAQAIIDSNTQILASDKSTEQQRLAAQSATFAAQLQIIAANKKAQLDDPAVKTDPTRRAQIELEAGAAVNKARADNLEKLRKITEDYQKRENAAEYQIMKDGIESQSKIAELQSADIKLSLGQRLSAYEQYEARQRQLINADADYQRQKAGLTSEELFAIEVQRQQKLTDLHTTGQAKQSEIILNALEQQQKHLTDSGQLSGLKQEITALSQLNEQYRTGAISAETFAKKKDEITNKAAQEALEIQLVTLQFIQGEYKRYGEDTMAIDLQIANLRKQLADRQLQQDEQNAEKRKKLQDAEVSLARQTEETISAFIKGRYEQELNAIQKKIDANDRAKEKETSDIETSSLSAQEKAAEEIELNAKVNAQNEALQRQQRNEKVKEAEFDRAKGILDVGINTAIAVTKVLPNIPLSLIMAGIGAAQIAAILARPIPKFAAGTASSPEGWAWTDELGPELYKTRRGETFIGSSEGPTLRYLQAGTEITPFGEYGQPATELITYEQLKQYRQIWPITQMQTIQQNDGIRRELQELNQTVKEGNRDMVRAIEKNKPIPPPRKPDPGPEFWAHIYNSCR
jgi:Na+-transporting methylmalonyl-CoA/oxaloacetate decarboxylase gamma subunit